MSSKSIPQFAVGAIVATCDGGTGTIVGTIDCGTDGFVFLVLFAGKDRPFEYMATELAAV